MKQRIRYGMQFFPFTLNTLVCALVAWLAYYILYKPLPDKVKEEDTVSAFRPFIILMGKIALWLIIVLILLSVLSTLITWAYYLWLKHKKNAVLQLSFTTESKNGKNHKLFMNAAIDGVRRPLLGFIKGRLYYDDYKLTDKFPLMSNRRKENSFWRGAITGKSRLALPDIKEYQLQGGFVFFEDMLHLFSLAVPQPVGGQFYQPPVLRNEEEQEVAPKKTETLDVRIDQMRKVEGEYLNYKDFEAGDDVRRIVWKVYAKSRDLVVRMPERFEPYASHLYFYASFHAAVKTQWLSEGYLKEMLNYYKNSVWTVYDTLSKKEWEMRYIPDLSFNVPENLSLAEKSARIISNSDWHDDKTLGSYFNVKSGTVLCISSFTDPQELARVLEQCDASTVVYFVKLSRTFRHFVPFTWLKRILFMPPKDRLSKLKSRWTFSPMRFQVQNKEKEIEQLLQRSNVTSTIM